MSHLEFKEQIVEMQSVLSSCRDYEESSPDKQHLRKCYTDASANFYLGPELSPLSGVEQRCLATLRHPAPVSVGGCVQYCRAAVTLHAYIRHEAEGGHSTYWLYTPEEKCRYAHGFIVKSLRLCYEARFGQEYYATVSALVREIFYCDQDLGFIFRFLGKSPANDYDCDILYPDFTQHGNSQRALYALEYYMNYIHIKPRSNECDHADPTCTCIDPVCSTYLNSTCCFSKSDLPLSQAAASANADALLLLLRYGANPFIRHGTTQSSNGILGGESAISILTASLNCLAFAKRLCQPTSGPLEILKKEEDGIIRCLQYIRRSVRSLPLISSASARARRMWNCRSHPGTQHMTVLAEFWPRLAELGLLGVPCLQHLARCVIREQLSRVNRCTRATLPHLVARLPLPGRLKSYTGLHHD